MNGTNDSHGCAEREQAAAFVLGALDAAESEGYERHLVGCASCRDDVARLQPSADALATFTPSVRAPKALRDRVMAQVRADAELFKAAGPDADRPKVVRRWPRRRVALIGATGALACGLAAGALVVDLGAGTPGVHTIQAFVAPAAPGAHAQLRRSGTSAELSVTGMPAPPSGKIYQVWLAHAGAPLQPTDALFSVNRSGSASVAVPGNLQSVKRVMVTAEPLGGSRHPTSPPIIIATL